MSSACVQETPVRQKDSGCSKRSLFPHVCFITRLWVRGQKPHTPAVQILSVSGAAN